MYQISLLDENGVCYHTFPMEDIADLKDSLPQIGRGKMEVTYNA